MNDNREKLRQLPSVDRVLNNIDIQHLTHRFSRKLIADAVREVLDEMRQSIHEGWVEQIEEERIFTRILDKLEKDYRDNLREVVNGTGVVIHTNLGRAPVPEKAVRRAARLSERYTNLEYDLEEGNRGYRHNIVKDLICKITGAEDALVVNNNAAAVLLVLSAMAAGKEVIISRGQLVEIGGSFRVPEVMEQSGARLVEVGTTNKTYIYDYENAINEDTGILLKVHTSNYQICGFTHQASASQLVELGRKYNIPVAEDIGSGMLVDLTAYGLDYEPRVQESIDAGIDIVSFSGDKLLGGPQAGIIAGKQKYIKTIEKHPLARAVRIDKLTLAVLESTLRYYLDEESVFREIPVLKMAIITMKELQMKAETLKNALSIVSELAQIEVEAGYSKIGGGSMPLQQMESRVISIMPFNMTVDRFDKILRNADIPIVGRISNGKYYIDIRTVFDDQFSIIVEAVQKALAGGEHAWQT